MSRIRILVADDNEAIREILISKLSNRFDDITAVADGGEALAAAKRLSPDLAILDISMPVLNGIEVARHLRRTSEYTALVFLTACTDVDVFDEAVATGAAAYVLKSRLGTDLMPAIELALAGLRFVSPELLDVCEDGHASAKVNSGSPLLSPQ